jgi:hypothetical protein
MRDMLFRPVAAERISIDYQTIESVATQENAMTSLLKEA